MKPERENDLVDVLDRLLNKGFILNADVIISVAGVPLIGIKLNAALASIETMLDFGIMEAWDKSTREWYAMESAKKAHLQLEHGDTALIHVNEVNRFTQLYPFLQDNNNQKCVFMDV